MSTSVAAERAADTLADFTGQFDQRVSGGEAALAVNYLDAFGYLGRELAGWDDITLGDIINAVRTFQDFFGLKKTGYLDPHTVRSMEKYRCGCPDLVQESTEAGVEYMRIKQFAEVNLPRWKKKSIKYAVEQYVSGLSKSEQDDIFDKAFEAWEKVCGISVVAAGAGQTADILIGTGQGRRSNFDGPGGTLAWAYLPQGDDRQLVMKFDIDEAWQGVGGASARGVLMLNVAAHEFGHLLGLDHSRVQTALMAPYYDPTVASPQANDDVPRAKARYGEPRNDSPSPPPTPPAGRRRVIEVVGDAVISVDGVVLS